jgi:hypothetical protein
MNEDLLKLFLDQDCDQHVQSAILETIKTKTGTDGIEDFTFNRFNVHLDFANDQAAIDDDLNPDYDECRLSLNDFAALVASVRES